MEEKKNAEVELTDKELDKIAGGVNSPAAGQDKNKNIEVEFHKNVDGKIFETPRILQSKIGK